MTSDHLTSDQWAAISPAVAKHFWGDPNPRLSRGDKWRWGNNGSKSLEVDKGIWKDFEADRGGGVIDLVMIEEQTDRAGAIQWLKDNGDLPESSPRRTGGRFKRRSARPIRQHRTGAERPRAAQKPKDSGKQSYALSLWKESLLIGEDANHPFRRWTTTGDKPGVLHPYCAVPPAIRWHGYKGGVIVAGVFPLVAWGKDGIPKGEPVAVQALAIDQNGQKRYVLGDTKDDKRSYGPVSEGVFIIGDPTSARVNIVEGVADALAVYSREPGAVLATLGTSTKLAGKEDVIDWLCTKETWLYPDKDGAGDRGTETLIDCIKVKSPDAKVFLVNPTAEGDDPGEWAKRTPFAEIERYDFEEKKGILFDSGMAWGEADRMAVQHFNGES